MTTRIFLATALLCAGVGTAGCGGGDGGSGRIEASVDGKRTLFVGQAAAYHIEWLGFVVEQVEGKTLQGRAMHLRMSRRDDGSWHCSIGYPLDEEEEEPLEDDALAPECSVTVTAFGEVGQRVQGTFAGRSGRYVFENGRFDVVRKPDVIMPPRGAAVLPE